MNSVKKIDISIREPLNFAKNIFSMEGQKYKIYINGSPLFITSPEEAAKLPYQADKNTFITLFTGKKKMILNYIDLLNKVQTNAVVLYTEDVDGLWNDFQSCFKVLEAAGGYVTNPENNLLVFYRRGSWDMPKGKIDPGETPEQAAVREVQEETGLVNIQLGEFLCHTYHTYPLKDKQILKTTWWYRMSTTDTEVTPQTEEDIEQILWVNPRSWLDTNPVVYGNIREVIEVGLK